MTKPMDTLKKAVAATKKPRKSRAKFKAPQYKTPGASPALRAHFLATASPITLAGRILASEAHAAQLLANFRKRFTEMAKVFAEPSQRLHMRP